jgi:hypothetical protein
MSYLVAPFCSELEELTYDLVEGAFRQEPSVSIDACTGILAFRSGTTRGTCRTVIETPPLHVPQAILMADFILSARTMNFDGLRSSWVRKLTM